VPVLRFPRRVISSHIASDFIRIYRYLSLFLLYLTLLTIMAVTGANSFAYCLNRKMLDMPELSSATSVRANISGEGDWEVVVLVQPSPNDLCLFLVRITMNWAAAIYLDCQSNRAHDSLFHSSG
jgi:hypothetical protein